MNNKIHKIAITAFAVMLLASGCSDKGNDQAQGSDGAGNQGGAVVEQPQGSDDNQETENPVENEEDQPAAGT
jgi:hypothetical protein